MDPDVKFSCGYKPTDANQNSVLSCGGIIFSAFFLIVLLTISILKREWFMLLLLLAFSVSFYGIMWKSFLDQYIHVTATELQVVRSDGKVQWSCALKDIWDVNAPDRDTLNFMVRSNESGVSTEVTLRTVADIDGLIAAIAKWGTVQSAAPHMIPELPAPPQPKPVPLHRMSEDEADELHAAQHLLNQGMISEQQYSGLLVPPVQQSVPLPAEDINAMNAADYQQRQEQLAQQLGMTQLEE